MLSFILEGCFAMSVARCEGFPQAIEVLTGEQGVDLIVCKSDPMNQAFFRYLLSVKSSIPVLIIESDGSEMIPPGLNILARVKSAQVAEDIAQILQKSIEEGKLSSVEISSEFLKIKTELMVPIAPLTGGCVHQAFQRQNA